MALKQTVKRGQSLVDLMKKFNSTSNRLLRDNPQLRRGVRPGTVLNVPRQPARPPISNYNYYAQYRPAANVKQARQFTQRETRFDREINPPRPAAPRQPAYYPSVPTPDYRYFSPNQRAGQAFQNFVQRLIRPAPTYGRPRNVPAVATPPRSRGGVNPANIPVIQTPTFQYRAPLPMKRIGAPAIAVAPPPGKGLSPERRRVGGYALSTSQPFPAKFQQVAPAPVFSGHREAIPPIEQRGALGQVPATPQGEGALWYRPTNARTGEPAHMFSAEVPRGQMIYQSFQRNEPPTVMLRSDQQEFGLTDDDMRSIGYVWDERNGHWEYGVPIEPPEVTGTAAPYGGYPSGYRPYYRRGYGGGGGGGGGYSGVYPYPEQQQRGQAPQREFRDPARFGLVSWRI